jgi:NAD(P)-dependent dehydrogenase (short-subunit alcohol dehydrogenase family)
VEAVKAFGVDAEAWAVDLQDLEAVKGVAGAVAARFGRIHSGIYAAGPNTTVNPLEQFLHVLNGGVLACFNLDLRSRER